MNAPHIHLLINHLPIIGLIIGIIVSIVALFSKKDAVLAVGMWIVLVSGISTYPTMYTGGASERFLEENEDKYAVSHDLIHEHEEAAELAFWLCLVAGVLAGITLIGMRKSHKYSQKAAALVVFIGIIGISFITRAGLTGGAIRHPEISGCCTMEGSGKACKGMSNCMHNGTDACCKADSAYKY